MRKVLLGLAVLLSATVASAQTKNLEKALADTQNAKRQKILLHGLSLVLLIWMLMIFLQREYGRVLLRWRLR